MEPGEAGTANGIHVRNTASRQLECGFGCHGFKHIAKEESCLNPFHMAAACRCLRASIPWVYQLQHAKPL